MAAVSIAYISMYGMLWILLVFCLIRKFSSIYMSTLKLLGGLGGRLQFELRADTCCLRAKSGKIKVVK